MMPFRCFFSCELLCEDDAKGNPGLVSILDMPPLEPCVLIDDNELYSLLRDDRVLKEFNVLNSNVSNKPGEKIGIPHFRRHQLMLHKPMTLYI